MTIGNGEWDIGNGEWELGGGNGEWVGEYMAQRGLTAKPN